MASSFVGLPGGSTDFVLFDRRRHRLDFMDWTVGKYNLRSWGHSYNKRTIRLHVFYEMELFKAKIIKTILLGLSVASLVSVGVFAVEDPKLDPGSYPDVSGQNVPNNNMVVTFEDNFKSSSIDKTKWNPFYPWPCVINQEMQAYIPDAFDFLPDGGLRVRADKADFAGQHYTSGSLTTFGKFSQLYGYFEMRAKLPKGRGFWPAFWLMPPPTDTDSPNEGEIDVLEALDHDIHTVHTTLHYFGPVSKKQQGWGQAFSTPQDLSTDYHNYAICWRPQLLVWLLDGTEIFRIEGSQVPSIPEYLLVNLAVGGNWPGPPDQDTPFPSCMDVRYVRAYQYKDLPPPQSPANFEVGAATLNVTTVHPGQSLTVQVPIYAGTLAYPDVTVMAQLADFLGHNYRDGITTKVKLESGKTAVATISLPVPSNLSPGIYTIGLGFISTEPKRTNFIGCAARFTVVAGP